MNAPGGNMNRINVLASSGKNLISKILPLPKTSRVSPNTVRAMIKPIPMPKGKKLGQTIRAIMKEPAF